MTLKMKTAAAACAAAALLAGCSKSADPEGTDLSAQARAAAEASGYVPPNGGEKGELHIYTWCDYIAPDVLASFERALGVKVIVDTFDSNEAMYAKLKASGTPSMFAQPRPVIVFVRPGPLVTSATPGRPSARA